MSDLHSIALALGMPERDPPNLRHYAPPIDADRDEDRTVTPDAESYFLAEQCPADSNFR